MIKNINKALDILDIMLHIYGSGFCAKGKMDEDLKILDKARKELYFLQDKNRKPMIFEGNYKITLLEINDD